MRRVILCSFAHPDDESFLVAGVACRYAATAQMVLVTATLGDAGKVGDPPLCTREQLPAVREAELHAAVGILGIHHLHLLGYRDRGLADTPPDAICERLVRLIRRYRPQIVITFDPNGANRHEDHVAISRFTSDAVAASSDARWFPDAGDACRVQRLLWTPPVPIWEAGRMTDLARQPGIDFLIDVRPWLQRKRDALRAHRTQHLSIDRVFFNRQDVDQLLSVEVFRQGYGPELGKTPAVDLFEGLE
jgi:LmbE family N-acetylglucosaminyl deacetylase